MSASDDTPPLAITGAVARAAAAARPSTSGPSSMPSRLMSVITKALADGYQPNASSSDTPAPCGPAVHGNFAVAVIETDRDGDDTARPRRPTRGAEQPPSP